MGRETKERRVWAAVLGLAAALLAAVLPTLANVSAPSPSYAETRVWAFDLKIPEGVGVERALGPTRTGAYASRNDEPAVGYPLGAAGLFDDAASVVTRQTRSGGAGVRVTRPDGSVVDITQGRVKEFIPNPHPNAPPGTLQRVKFPSAQPGSKGFKRDPTPQELEFLESLGGQ